MLSALKLGHIKIEKSVTLTIKKFFLKPKHKIDLEKIMWENKIELNNNQ